MKRGAIQLRAAREEDLPRLKQLWQKTVSIPLHCDTFFAQCFVPDQVQSGLVLLEDGVVQSMTVLLPTFWYDAEMDRYGPAPYVMTVATDEDRRHRKYGSWVLETACDFMVEKGAAALWTVLPDPSLELFFTAQGFWDLAKRPALSWDRKELSAAEGRLSRAEPEEYEAVREKILRGKSHIVAGSLLTALQRDLAEHGRGGMFCGELEDQPVCILAVRQGDTVEIAELLCEEAREKQAVSLLAELLPAERYTVREHPLGMLRKMNQFAKMERPTGYLGCGLLI